MADEDGNLGPVYGYQGVAGRRDGGKIDQIQK